MGREAPHRARDTARDVPLEHSPHLGGGTILTARWKHRISTDIDVLLPGRNTLIDLLQDNDPVIEEHEARTSLQRDGQCMIEAGGYPPNPGAVAQAAWHS